jgi:putative DNA methylase
MSGTSKSKPVSPTQVQAVQDRRFIEESFPVKEVGAASSKEKNIRQGHISTLHIWWARRPLAASRATAYAALTPYPKTEEERENKKRFIIDLCQWENSNNQTLLERARSDILEANGGVPPKILDPFAGGGSYPLEALRLGCETYANDYNPVAVLIEKASLEYPQRFGRPFENMPEWALPKGVRREDESRKGNDRQLNLMDDVEGEKDTGDFNPLLNAVRYWGKWVLKEASKELAKYYPSDPDGSIPVGYIWARTIPCQNPACGQEIPLMRQFWLAKKDKKRVAIYPDVSTGKINYRIVGDGYEAWPEGFNPENGTVARAVATCPVCGNVIDNATTHNLFRVGKAGQRMIAVITALRRGEGKIYRVATHADEHVYEQAEVALSDKRSLLLSKWGVEPVPDEPLPPKDSHRAVGSQLPLYNFVSWADLFNVRQKLTLITFVDIVRRSQSEILIKGGNEEFAKAVICYLALGVDRIADFGSQLCLWNYTGGRGVKGTFARQTLPMTWDYAESNPFNPQAASWPIACEKNEAWILQASMTSSCPVIASQGSATSLPYPDNFFDAILTDPPYYDNVPYSYLSDFFYVWLKRTIGHLYPNLFSTPLTPKAREIVAYSNREGGLQGGKHFFEENLSMAFREMYRILKQEGLAVIVYAHKSTEGWETVINALLDSGLVVTGAWPMNTEKEGRLNSQETAALASSIYIVTRKMPRKPTGFYNDVRSELRNHLDTKLHRLWEEGIGGADFFIAAIGSAIEVFGKYEQVMDYEGNIVRADRLLEEVRTIATDYAVRQILHNGFATEISGLTRLYVLWRWNYGEALVPFDEARKLAQSCGIDISEAWSKTGVIRKEKEFVRMLGPQDRKLDDIDDPRDLIDVLHKSLLLWEKGQRDEMVQALTEKGYGKSEAFYRVAQAISETLPNESNEKKLLDGFLAGRDRVQEEVEKAIEQGRLFT